MYDANMISPGHSWYEANIQDRPSYPPYVGTQSCHVAIVGGGYTGLSAAYHLAKGGADVILIDGTRFGDGASGRNGGQLGTGPRHWVETLEKTYGFERTKILFDMAEAAKAELFQFADAENINIEYQQGHLSVVHHKRLIEGYRRHIDVMARYGYEKLTFLERAETEVAIGSRRYHAAIRDIGTGHIDSLKLVVGMAKAAQKAGAKIYENTLASNLHESNGKYVITTQDGVITADRVLLATDAIGPLLHEKIGKYVAPLRSYIGATVPLPKDSAVLPSYESVDDSRYVVRYFRKTKDNVLLFGGAESNGDTVLPDIESAVRKQLVEIYPEYANIVLTHGWGGTVSITYERMPFIREMKRGLTYCGGYSGHGVMLAPYVGKLYAQAMLGDDAQFNVLKELKISSFPGGMMLRRPLLSMALKWFAMKDRI